MVVYLVFFREIGLFYVTGYVFYKLGLINVTRTRDFELVAFDAWDG